MFHAAIGGYGAVGVITEVELDLASNVTMERQIHRMSVADYPNFFNDQVRGDEQAILHNADLAPPYFDQATSVTWRASDKELTVAERLVVPGLSYKFNQRPIFPAAR